MPACGSGPASGAKQVADAVQRIRALTLGSPPGVGEVIDWGRERGRDPQLYWMRMFGEPTLHGPWSWRFGGHHVSVQHLVLDGRVQASTPCFLGADPAESPLLGPHLLRPLGGVEDLGRDLVRSLDEGQTGRALLTAVAPVDIVGGNRSRVGDTDRAPPPVGHLPRAFHRAAPHRPGRGDARRRRGQGRGCGPPTTRRSRSPPPRRGGPAADLTTDQQQMLRALLRVYTGRIPDELAEAEAEKFRGDKLLDVHFAWAGGIERGQLHYYRIQGPRFLAEYDNTQRDVNHIHSVWRDPEGDFGEDVLAQHRARFHRNG